MLINSVWAYRNEPRNKGSDFMELGSNEERPIINKYITSAESSRYKEDKALYGCKEQVGRVFYLGRVVQEDLSDKVAFEQRP